MQTAEGGKEKGPSGSLGPGFVCPASLLLLLLSTAA